jgi:O-antigen chain-terminating methyltransferase
MAFLMESRGFARVERRFLHPFGKEYLVEDEDSPVAKRFNEYFYGPQDYAIIGYKREETRSPLSEI